MFYSGKPPALVLSMVRVSIVIISLATAHAALAQVYTWVDDQGQTHFSDRAPNNQQAKAVEIKINSYTSSSIGENTELPADSRKVVMYSTSWCGYCKKARNYFKQQNIAFVEYDIETSVKGERDYKKLKGKGVPIILVGNKRMNGFSTEGFNQLYEM